jgi:acetyltransferase-like isoleucine patch superfamily enzyme
MSKIETGSDVRVSPGAVLGRKHGPDSGPTIVGDRATIRSGTIVYGDVTVGDDFSTGHNALVREFTEFGDDVLIGTHAVVDGRVTGGSHVSLQTGAYVPPETELGDEVFVGPGAVLTNDSYPVRSEDVLDGPVLEDHVTIGANATVLPGVRVGRGAFVGAGAVVAEDVPPETLAVGNPAEYRPLPDELGPRNSIA